MKIIFMGTPQFAVPILEGLLEDNRFNVLGVYTQPPREGGRGKQTTYSPIYQLAKKHNIPLYYPLSLKKSLAAQEELLSLQAEKIVVAAYGLILPKKIVETIDCINIHPSLLPRWRGAAPIQRTIMEGDKNTGICIMKMDEGMDTGDILKCEKIELNNNEEFVQFSLKLAHLSCRLLKESLLNFNQIIPVKQLNDGITYASKIDKAEGLINWQEDAALIERKSRAFSPVPGIYFYYQGERFKIIKADVDLTQSASSPGTIIDNFLGIACGKGILRPVIIQRAGKNPMVIKDFLKGFKIELGTKL